ncbi:putative Ca2+-dependent phospholipid-binding protein [Dioscorea alata]|uniref:Protein C2-DOMAIN ABA-RELATED 5-like isoform X1 n=2 Tax=Dioscorea TaxID=4672 RepID=A0AB40BVA9_DIOCR|nr:protein C2-DOMAIN ABA-RELATED 5-like isoform X1 [Dioscorea cayenensis subsp. rotundata]KAH7675524.1 putative Ca2+-dependent phospholipid-binding protein [Dioscorea alata]
MENVVGLLKVRVLRGVNLVSRDSSGSDPYLMVTMGDQKLKTSVKKSNVNPEWNEDLTLSVAEPVDPIKLEVFDKDTFTRDDKMGEAEFSIQPLLDVVKMNLEDMPDGCLMSSVLPSTQNCLAVESPIIWKNGILTQDVILRLRNVESGEIELQLQWVNIPKFP